MLFRFILLLLYIKLDDVSIFVCFFLVRRLKREIAGVSKIVNYERIFPFTKRKTLFALSLFFFFFFFFVSFLLRYWPYGKSLEGLRVHRIASGRNHMAFIVGTPFILSGNGGSNGGKSSGGGGHDSHDSGRETQKGGQGTSTSATAREEKGVLAHTMSIGTP